MTVKFKAQKIKQKTVKYREVKPGNAFLFNSVYYIVGDEGAAMDVSKDIGWLNDFNLDDEVYPVTLVISVE